jgi:hypothetical protein
VCPSLRGEVVRTFDTPGVKSCHGIAVSVDGRLLYVADSRHGGHTVRAYSVSDGVLRHSVGGPSSGIAPAMFSRPCQVYVSDDGFVWVAEEDNDRVQVLTAALVPHSLVGVGQLKGPCGVCASETVVIVAEGVSHRVSLFRRGDGGLIRRVGADAGSPLPYPLLYPCSVCFLARCTTFAVADRDGDRVALFDVEGSFLRLVGAYDWPCAIAASPRDDVVVCRTTGVTVVAADGSGVRSWAVDDPVGACFCRDGVIVVHRQGRCTVFT